MRENLRILSNSAKFSAGRPLLLPAYNFSATMASTTGTYRLGAVACLKFLATENMPRITVKLRIVVRRLFQTTKLSRPFADRHAIWRQILRRAKAENLLSKICLSHPKIWHRKNLKFTPNYREPSSIGSA